LCAAALQVVDSPCLPEGEASFALSGEHRRSVLLPLRLWQSLIDLYGVGELRGSIALTNAALCFLPCADDGVVDYKE
jgi:hypothetical protein